MRRLFDCMAYGSFSVVALIGLMGIHGLVYNTPLPAQRDKDSWWVALVFIAYGVVGMVLDLVLMLRRKDKE